MLGIGNQDFAFFKQNEQIVVNGFEEILLSMICFLLIYFQIYGYLL